MDITTLGAIEIRNKICANEITCVNAVSAFLEKIKSDKHNAEIGRASCRERV